MERGLLYVGIMLQAALSTDAGRCVVSMPDVFAMRRGGVFFLSCGCRGVCILRMTVACLTMSHHKRVLVVCWILGFQQFHPLLGWADEWW